MKISRELMEKIPKSDLHVHLDGSIRIETLIELAKKKGVELPSYTEEGLRELVFKEQYRDLNEYLRGFSYATAVLQDEESLERVAYELAMDNIAEGVRYVEVRFAPQLHQSRSLGIIDILGSVHEGLARAKREFNSLPGVQAGKEPPFEYGIIVCAMRMFDYSFSEYFDTLLRVHHHSERKWIFSIASLELVKAAVEANNNHNLPVVGFDLAGQEKGYPAAYFKEAYTLAHKNFLRKTVHAGEDYGPESIFQAITELNSDRIGHGVHLFNPAMIRDPDITDRQGYVKNLVEFIGDRRITIEVCLTSNMQTIPDLKDISNHSFAKMRESRLSLTFCTDNRTVSSTTVTNEISKAVKAFDLTRKELRDFIIHGFKRSFFPGSYVEKRRYVRRIIDYYSEIEESCSQQ